MISQIFSGSFPALALAAMLAAGSSAVAPALAQSAPPAEQQPATPADVSQISPIVQFELRGAYRFVPRADEARRLNSQASGTIEVAPTKPEWTSAQWSFEEVPGSPFVRIRNQWRKTYLTDVEGTLRATNALADADEAHWTFEPVDGTSLVQLRNRETDRFLLFVNGAPALVDDFRQDQEAQSHWSVNPAAAAGTAAMPRTPAYAAYDEAVINCRELGGYWTGGSCRASSRARPLTCPRGWAVVVGGRRVPMGRRKLPALADGRGRRVHDRSRLPWRQRADLAPRLSGVRLSARQRDLRQLPEPALRAVRSRHVLAVVRDQRRRPHRPCAGRRGVRQSSVRRGSVRRGESRRHAHGYAGRGCSGGRRQPGQSRGRRGGQSGRRRSGGDPNALPGRIVTGTSFDPTTCMKTTRWKRADGRGGGAGASWCPVACPR